MAATLSAVVVDITTLDVDAIVNAANSAMLGGGGVDGAIHRAAGSGLLEECRRVAQVRPGVRCPAGEARVTSGHDLPARHVIHTVGPVWDGGDAGEDGVLTSCYVECLHAAGRLSLRSIAFPAISTGVYGFPLERAAGLAVAAVRRTLVEVPRIERVVFANFDDRTQKVYLGLLAENLS